jgi:hypothetical protein
MQKKVLNRARIGHKRHKIAVLEKYPTEIRGLEEIIYGGLAAGTAGIDLRCGGSRL